MDKSHLHSCMQVIGISWCMYQLEVHSVLCLCPRWHHESSPSWWNVCCNSELPVAQKLPLWPGLDFPMKSSPMILFLGKDVHELSKQKKITRWTLYKYDHLYQYCANALAPTAVNDYIQIASKELIFHWRTMPFIQIAPEGTKPLNQERDKKWSFWTTDIKCT